MAQICPNCGSRNVAPAHEELVRRTKSNNDWKCSECGYSGPMPVE